MADTKRTCSKCTKKCYARGYCRNHYEAARSRGEFSNGRPCSVDECISAAALKGYCTKHYQRWRKWGDPNGRHPKFSVRPCSLDGCAEDAFCREMCRDHYQRWYEHGDPLHRYRGEVRNGKRICAQCGIDTPVENMRHSYCKPCLSEQAKAAYAYEPRTETMSCNVCGNEYLGYSKKTKYCSDGCREVGLAATKIIRDRRIRQTTLEYFTREEIFERDGWICHICDHPISRELEYPDPLSASLDHVIPVSRGGEHSRENTAASHFRCNIRKGARMAA